HPRTSNRAGMSDLQCKTVREGEAPAEPRSWRIAARQEARPPDAFSSDNIRSIEPQSLPHPAMKRPLSPPQDHGILILISIPLAPSADTFLLLSVTLLLRIRTVFWTTFVRSGHFTVDSMGVGPVAHREMSMTMKRKSLVRW